MEVSDGKNIRTDESVIWTFKEWVEQTCPSFIWLRQGPEMGCSDILGVP
jgi:hypothetical protein